MVASLQEMWTNSTCSTSEDNTSNRIVKLSLGAFIISGLVVSYLPQFIKIISEKSSYGISKLFLLLGFLGASSTLGNLLLLQSHPLYCCFTKYILLDCLQDTLGVTQMLVQFLLFSTLIVLFVNYSKYLPLDTHTISNSNSEQVEDDFSGQIEQDQKETRFLLIAMVVWFLILVCIVSTLLLLEKSTDPLIKEWWAGILGLLSAITGTLQYLPQIYTTVSTNQFGALSLETLLMQCPGSFIFLYSLSIQPGANWTSWISFLICGTCQFILICLFFIQKYYKRDEYLSLPCHDDHSDDQVVEEQSTLPQATSQENRPVQLDNQPALEPDGTIS